MALAKYDKNAVSGEYTLFIANSLRKVYCLIERDSKRAWTLVASWAAEKRHIFASVKFLDDFPYKENEVNLVEYRMSRPVIMALRADASLVSATCNYNYDGTRSSSDSFIASLASTDPFTLITKGCYR